MHGKTSRRRRRPGAFVAQFSIAEALEPRRLLSGSHGPIHLDPHVIKDLRKGEEEDVDPVPVQPGTVDPYSPPLGGTIEGLNFDTDANTTGFYFIPPDNSGAAGPTQVVNVVNTTIQFFTKAGAVQRTQRLGNNGSAVGSFFQNLSPANNLFDPRVLYDQYNGRFVVIAAERVDNGFGNPSNVSRVLIGVSDDSDPNGTWFFQALNTKVNISGEDRWLDYPAIGLDSQALYITGNEFGFSGGSGFGGSRLWVVNKTGLYSGGTGTVNVFDPSTSAGLPGEASTIQPAQMFGTAPGSTGTFFVSTGWVSGTTDFLSVIRLDNPLTSPTFSNQFVNLGDVDSGAGFGAVPQSGTATGVSANDGRASNVVWRNNALWTSNTISPNTGPDAGTATAHWYKVNTTNLASLSVADQGNVGAEDIFTGTRTFMPSIMVDSAGDMAMSFSASGPNIFPGAYYAGRLASDPAGTVQATGVLAAGQAFYIRTFGGPNRWGDYSSITLDPTDNLTFWAYNQYAATRGTLIGGEDGRWATRFGKFVLGGAVPAAPSTPDLTTATDTGASSTDNLTKINTPTFTGTAEPNSTVKIFANGGQVGSGTATAGGVYTVTTSPLADSVYSITATATNASGTGPISAALTGVTIDTVAPALLTLPGFNYLLAPHSVTYTFSENVQSTLSESDIAVQNTTTSATVPTASLLMAYNSGSNVATLTFPGMSNFGVNGILPDGNYTNTIALGNVTDLAGNSLAADTFNYFFLSADANHSKTVDTLDFNALAGNFGGTGRNFAQANFNYDASGTVDTLDFNLLASKFGASLPTTAGRATALAAAIHASPAPAVTTSARTILFSDARLIDVLEL